MEEPPEIPALSSNRTRERRVPNAESSSLYLAARRFSRSSRLLSSAAYASCAAREPSTQPMTIADEKHRRDEDEVRRGHLSELSHQRRLPASTRRLTSAISRSTFERRYQIDQT